MIFGNDKEKDQNVNLAEDSVKETKVKKEKPPKEPKVKKEKPPKEPKVKKEKPPKEPKVKKEKTPKEGKTPLAIKLPKLPNLSKDKALKEPKVKEPKVKEPKEKGPKFKSEIPFIQSINLQLIIGFVLPVLGIIILGIVSYDKASNAVVNSYEASAVQTVKSIDGYLTLVTNTVETTYKTYLNEDEIAKYFEGQHIFENSGDLTVHNTIGAEKKKEFYSKINTDELVEDILFISDKYEPISTNVIKASAKPYSAFVATENGKTMLGAAHNFHWFGNVNEADSVLGSSSNEYAIRLVRKLDGAAAAMIVDVDMEVVRGALDDLDPGKGGYVALIVDDGSEITGTANKDVTEKIFVDKKFYTEAMESAASGELSGVKNVKFNGKDYRFIYSRLDGKGMTVCALIAEDYLTSQVSDIAFITILVVVVAGIVAGAVGVLLASGISGTINQIIRGLKKVANGDFTVTVKTNRKDEFKLITDAVNDTVGQVKELISSVQEVNNELVQAADRVYSSSTFFMETSKNIKSSVGEIKIGAYRLDEDSDNCLAQMDKLSDKIETVTADTEEISKIVDVTNNSIIAGISSIEGVTESTQQTTRITGEVIESIEGLQDKSRSIGNIVKVINDIAEQTNLLSLNASIEAARAGEAGRGFAVVASEISKLAAQSLGSADQIRKIIDEILQKTSEVVEIAKEAFQIVQDQNSSVAGTTEAFEEMKENINMLLGSLQEITQNVVNMEGARAMTLESIENISAVSAETASCSESVSQSVESQNNAIYDLDQAANTLSTKSAQLTELLEKFTV